MLFIHTMLNWTTSGENVTNGSFDGESYLRDYLGSKRGSPESVIVLTSIYCVIFVTGVIGNVSTCIVIIKNSYMHTATNFYLFSLATSDLLILIFGLPPELYSIWESYPWRLGEPFCIFKSFLSEMTSYASVLTITAFTIERYVAICHPIKAQTLSSLSRAVKIIFSIWILACLAALPYPAYTRLDYYLHDPTTLKVFEESLICNVPKQWSAHMKIVFQISFVVFFVTPMTIITVMYILIGRTLNRSGFSNKADPYDRCSPASKARKAVIKMLVAVVIAFFVCWAPYHAQRLMTSHIGLHQWTKELMAIQTFLFYTSGVLYFLASTVNPALYHLMSRKFRQAFKRTLCRCCYTPGELAEMGGRSVLLNSGTANYTLYASMRRLSKDGTSMVSVQFNGFSGRGCHSNTGSLKSPSTSPVHGKLRQTGSERLSCNGFAVRNGKLSANLTDRHSRCHSVEDVRATVFSNPHTQPLKANANSYSNLGMEQTGKADLDGQSPNLPKGPSLNWVTKQGDRHGQFV